MHLLNLASCLLLSLSGEDPLLFGTVMLRETETNSFCFFRWFTASLTQLLSNGLN